MLLDWWRTLLSWRTSQSAHNRRRSSSSLKSGAWKTLRKLLRLLLLSMAFSLSPSNRPVDGIGGVMFLGESISVHVCFCAELFQTSLPPNSSLFCSRLCRLMKPKNIFDSHHISSCHYTTATFTASVSYYIGLLLQSFSSSGRLLRRELIYCFGTLIGGASGLCHLSPDFCSVIRAAWWWYQLICKVWLPTTTTTTPI